jgi:serine/threonine protein kinase
MNRVSADQSGSAQKFSSSANTPRDTVNVSTDDEHDVQKRQAWERAGSRAIRNQHQYKSIRDLMGGLYIDYMDLTIKKMLGEGAFAKVYLAVLNHAEAPQEVAVKMLKDEHLKHTAEILLFLKEIKTLKHLHHPNIVHLIGMGGVQDDKGKVVELFVVTEVCKGGTLRNLVQDQMITVHRKQYSLHSAISWCLQIAKALNYLHRSDPRVIHRDLKLENVILSAKPRAGAPASAKLADFGLATLLDTHQKELFSSVIEEVNKNPEAKWSQLTRTRSNKVIGLLERMRTLSSFGSIGADSIGSGPTEATGVAGSYGYMAPEVFKDQPYNEKVDIFSFGVLMYNLCYRVIPSLMIMSNGDNEDMVVYAKRVADGFRQPLNNEKVPVEINNIIEECWSEKPSDRPSAAKVVASLDAVLASGALDSTKSDDMSGLLGSNTCCGCQII